MEIIVDHFGLHFTDSGIGLLAQADGVQNALDLQLPLDLTVRKPRKSLLCPHHIDLSGVSDTPLPKDLLFQAMLPIPKPSGSAPVFVDDSPNTQEVLRVLMRLSSPSSTAVAVPLWMYKPPVLHDLLRLTNIQPLVITGYQTHHQDRLYKTIEMAKFLPRRLIVSLPPLWLNAVPNTVKTSLNPRDLIDLPLEKMGAESLRQYMLSKGT